MIHLRGARYAKLRLGFARAIVEIIVQGRGELGIANCKLQISKRSIEHLKRRTLGADLRDVHRRLSEIWFPSKKGISTIRADALVDSICKCN
jgi:hypothetical protein